jgi:hypothetical protein
LSSHIISKKLKIKIYRTVILTVVLYGCGIWSLAVREEHRLRVFENTVLRRIFGPQMEEDRGENCIMMNFAACIVRLILLGRLNIKEDEVGGTCSTHWEGERCLHGFSWEARREETIGKT